MMFRAQILYSIERVTPTLLRHVQSLLFVLVLDGSIQTTESKVHDCEFYDFVIVIHVDKASKGAANIRDIDFDKTRVAPVPVPDWVTGYQSDRSPSPDWVSLTSKYINSF